MAYQIYNLQMCMSNRNGDTFKSYRTSSGAVGSGCIFTFGQPKNGPGLLSGRNAIMWPGVETVSQAYHNGREYPILSGAMKNIIPVSVWVSMIAGTSQYHENVYAKKWVQIPFTITALINSYVWRDDITGANVDGDLSLSAMIYIGANLDENSFDLQNNTLYGNGVNFHEIFTSAWAIGARRGFNMPETAGACAFAVGVDERNLPLPLGNNDLQLAITFVSLS